MEVAVVMNVHGRVDVVRDTIDSIRTWMSNKIVIVVDQLGWEHFKDFEYPDTHVVCGLPHGKPKSPYKNFCVGFNEVYKKWPNVDWFCYTEYDMVVVSDQFREDLEFGTQNGISCMGRRYYKIGNRRKDHWMAMQILGNRDLPIYKMLGALMFFSRPCVEGLMKFNFFSEVLERSKDYQGTKFPGFCGFAVEEILFPSAAAAFGPIHDLGSDLAGKYLVRPGWQPVGLEEIRPHTTFAHPIKKMDERRLYLKSLRTI